MLLGLNDRAVQIAGKAEQVKSGANDTFCDFSLGGDNFFEWTVQTSVNTYRASYTSGSYKNESDFHTAIATYFRTKLSGLYGKNITNVTFISRTTGKSSDRYVLTFRAYFLRPVVETAQRTLVATNIQTTYYEILTKYFSLGAKSMTVPKTAKIAAPAAVSCSSKKAILIKKANSTQSYQAGTQLKLTQVSSSNKDSLRKREVVECIL